MADSRMADWDRRRTAEKIGCARAGGMAVYREEAEKEIFGGEVVGESMGEGELVGETIMG